MGGFTSTGPILAGRMTGLPTFIHESNAIPGKANRLNALLSKKVLLGFEECARYFPNKVLEVTGTPIRDSLRSPVDREPGIAEPAVEERLANRSGDGWKPRRTWHQRRRGGSLASLCRERPCSSST